MSRPAGDYSIQPASGYYGNSWPANSPIPEGFSSAGWTEQAKGYVQQTFLGASIRSFSMNGGFGDSSSQLTVELVNDEFNKSDGTKAGQGDDVYHSGEKDTFAPPIVGAPVFFKFGKNLATVEEAYVQTFNDLYSQDLSEVLKTPSVVGTYSIDNFTSLGNGQYVDLETNEIKDYTELLNSSQRGRHHIVFGGILQSYVQNRGPNGDPLYTVQAIDPREILSNCVLILNNYAGTTFNNNNMFNLYGFLEYNPSKETVDTLQSNYPSSGILIKKVDENTGSIDYVGIDLENNKISKDGLDIYYKSTEDDADGSTLSDPNSSDLPPIFPITGTGFSRRCSQGIPFYRVNQALRALFQFDGNLPEEYKEKGFGGFINFRGFKYVVDFGGLPKMPNFYYLDFDQINMLDLALEICDVTSRDLFVTLLPVINHPACKFLYDWNQKKMSEDDKENIIAGIIRVDSIDRSKQPEYGAVKSFIDGLSSSGIYVENQDVGFELSNVTTDKFIVGAQEVNMYYFTSNADRDILEIKKAKAGADDSALDKIIADQWKLETSLEQQILPYYGKLGKHAVTIPKGFGAYQQILLDTTGLNANGVGNYYVATEMELRCALISFDRWKQFLLSYNDIYLESIEENDAVEQAVLSATPTVDGLEVNPNISNSYAVTVPRSVFMSDDDDDPYGEDGLPKSPCNPPYGYPLYYKRATKVGIPEAGLTDIHTRYVNIVTNLVKMRNTVSREEFRVFLNSEWSSLRNAAESEQPPSELEEKLLQHIEEVLESANIEDADVIGLIDEKLTAIGQTISTLPKIAKKATENALRVYNFIKQVADECLGKKFLVKIPKKHNLWFRQDISFTDGDKDIAEYEFGPFGFKPLPLNSGVGYEFSSTFISDKEQKRDQIKSILDDKFNVMKSFLAQSDVDTSEYAGALSVNFNPVVDQYEFNYVPVEYGGFFDFDLLSNLIPNQQLKLVKNNAYKNMPLGIQKMLIPQDLTNFINDNGRISPYVRFDHSEFLAFDSVNRDSFTQQQLNADGMIPDVAENLDNLYAENNDFHRFPTPDEEDDKDQKKEEEKIPEQVAFVKCQIDDKFYMPPKTIKRDAKVYGRKTKDIGKFSKPKKIKHPETGELVDAIGYYLAHYVPDSEGDGDTTVTILDFIRRSDKPENDQQNTNLNLSEGLIESALEDLDTDNVYAIITLPGRIAPTKDSRFKDGPYQNTNVESVKHFLTMDTVKGLDGFDQPPYKVAPSDMKDRESDLLDDLLDAGVRYNNNVLENARLAYEKSLKGLSYAFPQQINLAMPSPVYPDLVALPLMSKERCYGPWVSSQSDKEILDGNNKGDAQAQTYANIGGRIEFIKDENLAPWNYAGYKAMNEAGNLQAAFSNSLLLFSERGGFTVPDAPSGVSLGKALLNNGPLVTNIEVSVSENGIRSTYQLDLYTASFGKLQKQKQDEISKMSRERQKLRDEKNALIRKGIGKSQRSENYKLLQEKMESSIALAETGLKQLEELKQAPTQIVATVTKKTEDKYSETIGGNVEQTTYGVDMAMQSVSNVGFAAQNFPSQTYAAKSYYNSAGGSLTDNQTPASMDYYHHNMSHKHPSFQKARRELYKGEDAGTEYKTYTIYEE